MNSHLSPTLERRLAIVAARRGQSLDDVLQEAVERFLEDEVDTQDETLPTVAPEEEWLDWQREITTLADAAAEEYVENGGEPLDADDLRQLLGRRGYDLFNR